MGRPNLTGIELKYERHWRTSASIHPIANLPWNSSIWFSDENPKTALLSVYRGWEGVLQSSHLLADARVYTNHHLHYISFGE